MWNYKYILNQAFKNYSLCFNWRIIVLQCCVSFCCSAALSIYTSPPSRASLPPPHPTPPPITPEFPVLYSRFPLAILYVIVYVSATLPTPHGLFPPCCVHKSSLHLCLYCCPANRLDIGFSLSDFTLFIITLMFLNLKEFLR